MSDNSPDISIEEVYTAKAIGVKHSQYVSLWGVVHHDVGVLTQRHTAD